MYIHSSNETVKRINVSKIANTSTLGDITVLQADGQNQLHDFAENAGKIVWRPRAPPGPAVGANSAPQTPHWIYGKGRGKGRNNL